MSMGRSALMVAAALGLGSIAGAGMPLAQMIEKAAMQTQQPRRNKRGEIFGGLDDVRTSGGARRGARGWSNRHVQRTAQKKRNQARHRAACRGRSRSRV